MQPAIHERPGKQSRSTHPHAKAMLKTRYSWSAGFDLKAMRPINTTASQPEENSSPRFILLNTISNRAMTAHCSNLQWTVEAHSRPAITRPEQVLVGCQGV